MHAGTSKKMVTNPLSGILLSLEYGSNEMYSITAAQYAGQACGYRDVTQEVRFAN